MIFDKTGTLTTGKLEVTEVLSWAATAGATAVGTAAGGAAAGATAGATAGAAAGAEEAEEEKEALGEEALGEDGLLALAASAERGSEHPIGQAIVAAAVGRGLSGLLREPTHFEASPGHGLSCMVGGRRVLIGSRGWMRAHGLRLDNSSEVRMARAEEQGETAVLVATELGGRPTTKGAAGGGYGGGLTMDETLEGCGLRVDEMLTLVGMISVSDTIKPEARAVVASLEHGGVECWMVTGDNERTARCMAARCGLGVSRVLPEVKPEMKAAKVEELQQMGKVVGMVGDGVNDAPALAQADVGFAVATGTDVAIEAADIVLMKSNLNDVLTAIDLSKVVMRRIRISFVWAFAQPVDGTLRGGVLYPSTHTAAADVCGSRHGTLLRLRRLLLTHAPPLQAPALRLRRGRQLRRGEQPGIRRHAGCPRRAPWRRRR